MTAPHDPAPTSTAALLADIMSAAARLLRGEMALLQVDARQSLILLVQAVLLCLLALALGLAAVNMLAEAGVAALILAGLPPVWAKLCSGLALLVLAYGAARWGMHRVSKAPLDPARTLGNLGRDLAVLKSMWKADANV